MLYNATGFKKIVLITGYSDLRRGIDGLASELKYKYNMNPFEEDTIYLFCGRSAKKLKGLVWDKDGFLLLVKRLEADGRYQWPRSKQEALSLSQEQFHWLMNGLSVVASIHPIRKKLTI